MSTRNIFAASAWRSYLMTAHGATGLSSVWQSVLEKGWIVGGLLGFIVPIIEMFFAYAASHWLIVPLISGALAGTLWGVAGWHSPVPAGVDRARQKALDVERRANRVRMLITKLSEVGQSLTRPLTSAAVAEVLTDLSRAITSAREEWERRAAELRAGAEVAVAVDGLGALQASLESEQTRVLQQWRELLAEARKLEGDVRRNRGMCAAWNHICRRVAELDREGARLEAEVAELTGLLADIRQLLTWRPEGGPPPVVASVSATEADEIAELVRLSVAKEGDPAARTRATAILDQAGRALADADTRAANAAGAASIARQLLPPLQVKFQAPVEVPSSEDIAGWLARLRDLHRALVRGTMQALKVLRGIGRECGRAVPWWRRQLERFLPDWLLPRGRDRRPRARSRAAPRASEEETEEADESQVASDRSRRGGER